MGKGRRQTRALRLPTVATLHSRFWFRGNGPPLEIVVRIELTLTGLQPAAFPLGYTIINNKMALLFHHRAVGAKSYGEYIASTRLLTTHIKAIALGFRWVLPIAAGMMANYPTDGIHRQHTAWSYPFSPLSLFVRLGG